MVKWYKEGRFPFDKLTKFMKAEEFDQGLKEMHDGVTVSYSPKGCLMFDRLLYRSQSDVLTSLLTIDQADHYVVDGAGRKICSIMLRTITLQLDGGKQRILEVSVANSMR